MDKINIKINNTDYQVEAGTTILEACNEIGILIPTLCWMKDMNQIGACRMCMVEVKGARTLVTACVYPVNDGMEVITNSAKVQNARKTNLELILSDHDQDCLSCVRSTDCELQQLCKDYGVESGRFDGEKLTHEIDESTSYLVRDNNKCILCRRCVAACKAQHVGVIEASDRGFNTHIACAFESDLEYTSCISCGQCIVNCPTGALHERDDTAEVTKHLNDPDKIVIVHTAPAIRATLGEAFGMPVGTNVEGKLAAALRRLGFNKVFDTDFAADFTILEEANEFVGRVKNGGTLPIITSCCPGWIKFAEFYHPDLFENLSSCKSPQGMMGAMIKTYWAEKNGVDPANIVVVSIMPCTAKKYEVARPEMHTAGELVDNDYSLTTRELSRMIKRAGLTFENLPNEDFDTPLGESTGAAVIFGASGGVLEAALRTAAAWVTGQDELDSLDFKEVRGEVGLKEATYKVGDLDVSVCAVSGMDHAEKLLRAVKNGEKNYHVIEIMACPGGCINGGGQPTQPAKVRNFVDLKKLRSESLYANDAEKGIRSSHKNEAVLEVYKEYFKEPGSHKAHDTLHTHYEKKTFDF